MSLFRLLNYILQTIQGVKYKNSRDYLQQSCDRTNLTYMIPCKKCKRKRKKQYMGETKRRLYEQMSKGG